MIFQYLVGKELGLVVALATPSLYVESSQLDLAGAGVLEISQSGRSPGVREILQHARQQSRPSAALTNDVSSPIATECDVVMDMSAGPERAVASTSWPTWSSASRRGPGARHCRWARSMRRAG